MDILPPVVIFWQLIVSSRFLEGSLPEETQVPCQQNSIPGPAWSREEKFAFDRARTGCGLGLRLLMPAVDMSRFDIGFDGEGNRRVHLAVFSKMAGQRFRLR